MRVGLCQLNSTDSPKENLPVILGMIREAAEKGAEFVLTPEVSNCVSNSRKHQQAVLSFQSEDETLAAIRNEAATLGIWILIGSLGIKLEDEGRFANRSFLISPTGEITASYDKIHMFDVELSEAETYKESAGYRPGEDAVVAETPFGNVGMTVCYDVRFPQLHRALAEAGAQIITQPAAFTTVSGEAHWHVLLRARAIETGCFVLAPAQCGSHSQQDGSERRTYGHSLVVSPWGEVLADAGEDPGVMIVDIDLAEVETARRKIPSLKNARAFKKPS
ncbi:carbon-nitrogen hydrolase family protein [Halocynthiibacter sp. C4]|uniref:carbon-nitrogen hydrolase family protein n=1 Tax=Halocynthiibacter sp. C4 TaxID=2992758 RepID=UPI00237AA521|nr:carbon-nitrogen hydrolase family protein [Halocynthiibacter sp. C4]MDE0590966.1 carbon-nitrogen hydrolase family protein [Halocynthiibacter sp. C4]